MKEGRSLRPSFLHMQWRKNLNASGCAGGFQFLRNQRAYLPLFSMPPQLFLGKNQLIIDEDLEGTTSTRFQLPATDIRLQVTIAQNVCRQTDDTRCIVSRGTIDDADVEE